MTRREEVPEWYGFYRGRRVLVTGHTGFKGSWLSEWLLLLGARVSGYSLEPETEPSMFRQLDLSGRLDHHIGDVRDPVHLQKVVEACQPEVVFHLAAQPLVCPSYVDPVRTYSTNVMGAVHLLEALRDYGKPCAAVFITSDKCYENSGARRRAFREDDPMGGVDPYSSSKGCAELVIHSYRRSFFSRPEDPPVAIASARAGNVIGGGDWAVDRIVPDCIRSLLAGSPIRVRNRHAVRPWQHVLEPLRGYLTLGHYIFPGTIDGEEKTAAFSCFNFGPSEDTHRPVERVVTEILAHWPGEWIDGTDPDAPHEADFLTLDSERAWQCLSWFPVWDFAANIRETVDWYRHMRDCTPDQLHEFTLKQIVKHARDAVEPAGIGGER